MENVAHRPRVVLRARVACATRDKRVRADETWLPAWAAVRELLRGLQVLRVRESAPRHPDLHGCGGDQVGVQLLPEVPRTPAAHIAARSAPRPIAPAGAEDAAA